MLSKKGIKNQIYTIQYEATPALQNQHHLGCVRVAEPDTYFLSQQRQTFKAIAQRA